MPDNPKCKSCGATTHSTAPLFERFHEWTCIDCFTLLNAAGARHNLRITERAMNEGWSWVRAD